MLSPSDFNNAVPQFTNGDYASNPINPQYIAEPDAVDYNRGTEPLQTLPAQWWNWFLNKFTNRFNKVNIYVKNIFNELTQLLSLVSETPSGTEGSPTVEQLKTMFACCYPTYVKETEGLVPNTTTVNGHALTGNVSVTRSDLGLGTSATVNTGSGAGCIPTVGTALGSTANKIVLTTSSGTLQPSSSTVGSAAYCDASCFRASTWTPTCVACAGANGSGVAFGSASTCDASCFRASTWTPSSVTCATKISRTGYTSAYSFDVLLTNGSTTADGTVAYVSNQCRLLFCNTTGVLTAKTFCGSLSGTATTANCAGSVVKTVSGASQIGVIYFCTNCTNSSGVSCARTTCIWGENGYYYGNICGNVCGLASRANYSTCLYNRQTGASKVSNVFFYTSCTNASCIATNHASCICGTNGYYYGNICGCLCGTASCAVNATNATSATNATNADYASSSGRTAIAGCAESVLMCSNAWCVYCSTGNNIVSVKNRCSFAILVLASNRVNCHCCIALPSIYLPAGYAAEVCTMSQWWNTPLSCITSFNGIRLC